MITFNRAKIHFETPLLEWQYFGIYCPNCLRVLYDFVRVVDPDDVADASDIKAKPGIPTPTNGQQTICPACGYDWLSDPLDRRLFAQRN